MKCSNCGKELPKDAKFCIECGTGVNESSTRIMAMTCPTCNAPIKFKPGQTSVICEFCGKQSIIKENDNVTIERIKAQTEKDRLEAEKEKKEEQKQKDIVDEAMRRTNDRNKMFRDGAFFKLDLFFGILSIIGIYLAFAKERVFAGFISIFQVILFTLSIIIGLCIIKTNHWWIHYLLAIIGMALVCLWMCFFNGRFAG